MKSPSKNRGRQLHSSSHRQFDVQSTSKSNEEPKPPRRRWFTVEFYIYYVVIVAFFAMLIYVTVDMGRPSNPAFPQFSQRLSQGWLFGRLVDNSDAQYAGFRNNFPILVAAMLGHIVVGALLSQWKSSSVTISSPLRFLNWQSFNLIFSFGFIGVLHGLGGLLKIVGILCFNFALVKLFRRFFNGKFMVALVWTSSIAVLFLNDKYRGYKFADIVPPLAFLDQYNGVISRWYVTFNISILRIISFAVDYYWFLNHDVQDKLEKNSTLDKADLSTKERVSNPHPERFYGLYNYLSYCMYVPLYMAGPIISFNAFISQIRYPPHIPFRQVTRYAIRFIIVVFTMELMMHYFYVVAISKTKSWDSLTPIQLTAFSYWNLKFIWFKLLIIWRFFRLWAMADGIMTEENMTRCMSNNYSPIEFWKTWHRSYNRWLVRYMYIPLGGNQYKHLNIFVVFSFVAVWHDIELRLLIWGWLIALFILPELLISSLAKKYLSHKEELYRWLCAAGAAINIYTMIIANLIGFCDGAADVIVQLFSVPNAGLIISVYIVIMMVAHIMFEIRNEEARQKTRNK